MSKNRSPEHVHEPDLSTLHVEFDGGDAYLDIDCACGESGCVGEIRHDPADGIFTIVTNDGQILKFAGLNGFDTSSASHPINRDRDEVPDPLVFDWSETSAEGSYYETEIEGHRLRVTIPLGGNGDPSFLVLKPSTPATRETAPEATR